MILTLCNLWFSGLGHCGDAWWEETGGGEVSEKGVERDAQQASALPPPAASRMNKLRPSWQVSLRWPRCPYQGRCHFHFNPLLIVPLQYVLFISITKVHSEFSPSDVHLSNGNYIPFPSTGLRRGRNLISKAWLSKTNMDRSIKLWLCINQVIDDPHAFPDMSHTVDMSGNVWGSSNAGVLSHVEWQPPWNIRLVFTKWPYNKGLYLPFNFLSKMTKDMYNYSLEGQCVVFQTLGALLK